MYVHIVRCGIERPILSTQSITSAQRIKCPLASLRSDPNCPSRYWARHVGVIGLPELCFAKDRSVLWIPACQNAADSEGREVTGILTGTDSGASLAWFLALMNPITHY